MCVCYAVCLPVDSRFCRFNVLLLVWIIQMVLLNCLTDIVHGHQEDGYLGLSIDWNVLKCDLSQSISHDVEILCNQTHATFFFFFFFFFLLQ